MTKAGQAPRQGYRTELANAGRRNHLCAGGSGGTANDERRLFTSAQPIPLAPILVSRLGVATLFSNQAQGTSITE
ncbi:Uncharacterised protein [Mycobacteroides abscessus subsp. abscessus]|nr:Uncharacterised protein [Mycobacteroides abscessus subsp. abscessus]